MLSYVAVGLALIVIGMIAYSSTKRRAVSSGKNACTACESCLMPFGKDPGHRENERYCSYCFRDGKLCYEGDDRKEFQRVCYAQMRKDGVNPLLARFFAFMIRFAPRWRKR